VRDEEHIEKAFDSAACRRARHSGASMVAHGFTAVEDRLFRRAKLLRCLRRRPDPQELVRDLGATFEVMNTNINAGRSQSYPGAPRCAARLDAAPMTSAPETSIGSRYALRTRWSTRERPNHARHLPAALCALMRRRIVTSSLGMMSGASRPAVLAVRTRITLTGDMPLAGRCRAVRALSRCVARRTQAAPSRPRVRTPEPDDRARWTRGLHLVAPILGREPARRLCDAVWGMEASGCAHVAPLLRHETSASSL